MTVADYISRAESQSRQRPPLERTKPSEDSLSGQKVGTGSWTPGLLVFLGQEISKRPKEMLVNPRSYVLCLLSLALGLPESKPSHY